MNPCRQVTMDPLQLDLGELNASSLPIFDSETFFSLYKFMRSLPRCRFLHSQRYRLITRMRMVHCGFDSQNAHLFVLISAPQGRLPMNNHPIASALELGIMDCLTSLQKTSPGLLLTSRLSSRSPFVTIDIVLPCRRHCHTLSASLKTSSSRRP